MVESNKELLDLLKSKSDIFNNCNTTVTDGPMDHPCLVISSSDYVANNKLKAYKQRIKDLCVEVGIFTIKCPYIPAVREKIIMVSGKKWKTVAYLIDLQFKPKSTEE